MTPRRRVIGATAILSLVPACASPTTSEAPSVIPPGDYDAHDLLDDEHVSHASVPFTVTM